MTYDSYVPLYNRFHRGEWITWVSGGEGALDTPGPLNGTSEDVIGGRGQASSFSKFCPDLYFMAQSTHIYRVPQCMSPRRNCDSPIPSLASECAPPPPPPNQRGGHTRPRVRGWRSPKSDDWKKSLALCLLCILGWVRAEKCSRTKNN